MAEKLAKDLHHFGIVIPGDVALAMVRNRGWEKIKNDDSKPGFHVVEERIMDNPKSWPTLSVDENEAPLPAQSNFTNGEMIAKAVRGAFTQSFLK